MLKSKIQQNLVFFFLLLVCFYPLVKFNISSMLFICFSGIALIYSLVKKTYNISKKNILSFLGITSFYIILIISCFYSENTKTGFLEIIQLSPLLFAPFIIIILKPIKLNNFQFLAFFNVFLMVNIIYSIVLIYFFFKEFNNLNIPIISYDKVQYLLVNGLDNVDLFIHKAYFSMGFVLSSMFALYQINSKAIKKINLAYFIVFFYFSLLIIYTFSVPNIIAYLICVLIFSFFKIQNINVSSLIKNKSSLILAASVVFIIIFFLGFKLKSEDNERTYGFLFSFFSNKEISKNDAREEIYKSYINLYKESSLTDLIFGYGIGDSQEKLTEAYAKRLNKVTNKNILFYNEAFDDEYWFKNNLDIVPNITTNPEEVKNAELVITKQTNKIATYNISTEVFCNQIATFSVFVKPDNVRNVIIRMGELERQAVFDFTKSKINVKSDKILNSTIEKTKNGWYRCSISTKLDGESIILVGLSNENGQYVYERKDEGKLFLWGAQLELGPQITDFVANKSELILYAYNEELNTHNNYLFFIMSGGILCLISFIFALAIGFKLTFKNKNFIQICFLVIVAINLFTENILSRHWGLMFVALFLIILFIEKEEKVNILND